MPAQFQTHPFDLVGRPAHELLAHFRRAGKTDLPTDGILQELVGDFLGWAHDQIGDARRQARFDHALEDFDEAQRRLTGGLGHHGAASCQRRRDFARLQGNRKIPRANRSNNSHRMFDRHMSFAEDAMGDDLAVGALAFLSEPFKRIRGMQHLCFGFRQGFPLFHGHGAGDVRGEVLLRARGTTRGRPRSGH